MYMVHTELYVHEWKPLSTPICVVVIAHGMGEHGGRYSQLAERLTTQGYVVYAPDHRGHGRTAGSKDRFGHFADRNGWNIVVEDLRMVIQQVRLEYPHLPIILYGHSMGSLLSRRYIQRYGDTIQGVMLSGTSGDPGFMGSIGKLIALWEMRSGSTTHSALLLKLLFGGFNKKFKPHRTAFDWLTRDTEEVDRYIHDEWVGKSYSTSFFYDLITGVNELNKRQQLLRTPRQLPILLFSGEQDPVGNFGKGVQQTYDRLCRIGCTDVTLTLYKNARHELINELNREEVFLDMISWLQAKAPIHVK
jgi:alpha-beta hydrolase superfamily lysophospholipase